MSANDSDRIEEMMNQARFAELDERNEEALAILRRVVIEADDVDDKMFAAGTAFSLIVNKFLSGTLPRNGTPEYDECYEYLRIAVESYDLSHPMAQAAFGKVNDINYLNQLLARMEREIVAVQRTPSSRVHSVENVVTTASVIAQIYIHKNNQTHGPYEESVVAGWLETGQLSPNDLFCRHGMTEWQPLTKVLSSETRPQASVAANLQTEMVQGSQDIRPVDKVRVRLDALLATYPNDFRVLASSKDIENNKVDISNTEVHGPFDNTDARIVEILEQSLTAGRQAFMLPVGQDRVLVQTSKSGKLFDVQRSSRDQEISFIMKTLEEIHSHYVSNDGNPYLIGGLDSYIYPEKFVGMAEKFGYSKTSSYDIADVAVLDVVRRFAANHQIVIVSAWTKEERIDVYIRS